MSSKGEFDEKSGYSFVNLSFVCNIFAPIKHINFVNAHFTTKRIKEDILTDFPNNAHIYHELVGQTFDGCITPPFFNYTKEVRSPVEFHVVENKVKEIALSNSNWVKDTQVALSRSAPVFDWVIIPAEKLVGDEQSQSRSTRFLLDCKDTAPGYTRLKIINPSNTDDNLKIKIKGKSRSEDFYLSSKSLEIDIRENLYQKKKHIQDVLLKHKLDLNGIEQYLEIVSTSNIQVALPCKTWPTVAGEWISRKRKTGWPNATMIENIISRGIHILPNAHVKSSKPDAEWKFGFSLAESTLCLALNDVQRQVVVILNMLMYYSFIDNNNSHLNYDLIKTAVFWTTEEIPQSQWTSEHVGSIVLQILDKLIQYYSNGHFPNYFMEKCNLIDSLKSNEKKQILKILKDIRKDPIQKYVAFTEDFQLLYLPYSKDMSEILAPVLDKPKSKKDDTVVKAKHLKVYDLLAFQLMKEYAFHEGVDWYTKSTTIYNALAKDDSEPLDKILTVITKLDEMGLVNLYTILLEIFPDSKYRLQLLETLAMECQIVHYKTTIEAKQEIYREKADDSFSCAVTMPTCPAHTKVMYAHFLYRFRQYQLAIEIVENILNEKEVMSEPETNSFRQRHIKCVDTPMQEMLNTQPEITFPSIALMYYVLTTCYYNMGKRDQAEVSLVKFKLACDNINSRNGDFSGVVIDNANKLLDSVAKTLGHRDITRT